MALLRQPLRLLCCRKSSWGLMRSLAWVGLILHGDKAALGLGPLCLRMVWVTAGPGAGQCAMLASGTAL